MRVDHQLAPTVTTFARYSFVDTDTFRPSPLPGLAEGSFNDAFGSNLNRSQGLALGATWIASSTLVGDSASALPAGTTSRIRRTSASTPPPSSALPTSPTIRRSSAACRR